MYAGGQPLEMALHEGLLIKQNQATNLPRAGGPGSISSFTNNRSTRQLETSLANARRLFYADYLQNFT